MHTYLATFYQRHRVTIALLLTIGLVFIYLGELAQAREAESPNQMPQFAADIYGNAIHNWYWLPNTQMTWDIDGPDVNPGFDFQAQGTTDDNGYILIWLQGWDIQPGDTIQASDGTSTTTFVVEPLAITTVDIEADIISGTSNPGRPVTVYGWGSSPVAATDDGAGNWQAILTGTYDIMYCSGGVAEILDTTSGNFTYYTWNVHCLQVKADPNANEIWGSNWQPNTLITFEVDDYTNGSGVDHTYTSTSDDSGEVPKAFTDGYDLKPGDTVTASYGGESNHPGR